MHHPSAHDDTETRKYQSSFVIRQMNYNKNEKKKKTTKNNKLNPEPHTMRKKLNYSFMCPQKGSNTLWKCSVNSSINLQLKEKEITL